MARITFSLPDDISEAATKRAEQDRRSVSSYITQLVEADVKASGFLGGGLSEELRQAIEQVGQDRSLKAIRVAARKLARA